MTSSSAATSSSDVADRVRRDLDTVGWTRVPGLLDEHVTRELGAALARLSSSDDETWGADRLVQIQERGALRNLAAEDDIFLRLLDSVPTLDIVDDLLGPKAVLNCFDALTLFPGGGRFPWDFHTDLMDLTGVAFPPSRRPGVTVLYYFDEVRESNGATWVVPGSQHGVVQSPDTEVLAALAEPMEVGPGDSVILDPRVWHCAGTNNADAPRTLIKTMFTAPWYRPQMDFTRAVPPDVLAGLSNRARRYLGVENVPPTTVAELRRRLSGVDDLATDGS